MVKMIKMKLKHKYEVGFTKKFQKKYGAISDASNALTFIQYAYSPPRTLLFRAIKKNLWTSRASRGYNFHLPNGAEVQRYYY